MARKKKSSKDVEADIQGVEVTNEPTDATALEGANADETADAKPETPEAIKDHDTDDQPAKSDPTDEIDEDDGVSRTGDEPVDADSKDEEKSDSLLVLSSDSTANSATDDDGSDATENSEPTDDADVQVETEERVNIPETPPAAQPDPVVVREGGFFPTVIGGVIAAAIGFGLAQLLLPDSGADTEILTEIQRKQDGQGGVLSKLRDRVETLETESSAGGAGVDLSGIEAVQSDNRSAISGLNDRLTALEAAVEKLGDGQASDDAVSGAALADVRRELERLQSTVGGLAADAAQMEENARAAANATLQRAVLTRIQTALDAGAEFQSAVVELEDLGAPVPDELKRVAPEGVTSLAELQESFPDAARAALAASRGAGDGSDNGGITGFLRVQLGARSLTPREGGDPDAVLSRAETAARDGRLMDALAEIEALPEEARTELSNWSQRATERLEAVAAAQALSDTLN